MLTVHLCALTLSCGMYNDALVVVQVSPLLILNQPDQSTVKVMDCDNIALPHVQNHNKE